MAPRAAVSPPDGFIKTMPVMDGFEFLKKVRSHPKLQDLIVLVSSASVFEVTRRHLIKK